MSLKIALASWRCPFALAQNNMKPLLLLLLFTQVLSATPITLKLNYEEGENDNYPKQIQAAFVKLLASNKALAKEFSKFESPPPEDSRGRYSGNPTIQILTLAESEHVDFRDSASSSQFGKTIALYFRFDEGVHRGSEFHSGFFALFEVKGELSYRHVKGDEFELQCSKVVATFKGFRRTLTAPLPSE